MVTVSAANAPPTISDIPNQTISADTILGPINFSVGDTASIWSFGDANNTTSISTNTAFTYTDPGTYTVQVLPGSSPVMSNFGSSARYTVASPMSSSGRSRPTTSSPAGTCSATPSPRPSRTRPGCGWRDGGCV